MGLVGLRRCPACRHMSSALCLWVQAPSLCCPAVQPCSIPCLGGHLCPSHLVAPDAFKESHWCGLQSPGTARLLAQGVGGSLSPQDGPEPVSVCGSSDEEAAPPHGSGGRKLFLDSPSLG